MKSRIFMYLFIFTALFVLFQYVNTKRYVESTTPKIDALRAKAEKLEDSIKALRYKNLDQTYFSLENNEEALSHFDALAVEDMAAYISDKLIETNEQQGDNPLIPYAGMNGPMKINKIKLLNHKWIIADFSDGKYWGELLIAYEVTPDLSVEFTVIEHLLYTTN